MLDEGVKVDRSKPNNRRKDDSWFGKIGRLEKYIETMEAML
jgi:hypothetical protein